MLYRLTQAGPLMSKLSLRRTKTIRDEGRYFDVLEVDPAIVVLLVDMISNQSKRYYDSFGFSKLLGVDILLASSSLYRPM